jgi:sugar (pentulose or hexulose) kinase
VLFGLGPEHKQEHLYRSALEGIAFSLYRNKLLVEASGVPLGKRVIVTGGSAHSALFRGILADVLNVSILPIGGERGADYAAAWLAGRAVGAFSGYELLRQYGPGNREERPNRRNHDLYRELYDRVYADLYPNLKRYFRRLATF